LVSKAHAVAPSDTLLNVGGGRYAAAAATAAEPSGCSKPRSGSGPNDANNLQALASYLRDTGQPERALAVRQRFEQLQLE
jgi:hypothetical protein